MLTEVYINFYQKKRENGQDLQAVSLTIVRTKKRAGCSQGLGRTNRKK